jgi:hypothetical protein
MYAAYLLSMPNDDLVLISDLQGSKLHLNATIGTTVVCTNLKVVFCLCKAVFCLCTSC